MLKKWISAAFGATPADKANASDSQAKAHERDEALRESNEALGNGDLALARAKLDPLLVAGPEDAEVLAAAGLIAFLSSALEEARRLLEKAVKLDPLNANATKLLAGESVALALSAGAVPNAAEIHFFSMLQFPLGGPGVQSGRLSDRSGQHCRIRYRAFREHGMRRCANIWRI